MCESFAGLFESKYFWITAILLVLYLYVKFAIFGYWKRRGVPCAVPWIPFSDASKLVLGKISLGNHMKENYEKFKTHRFNGIYMFHMPVLMINDPELIRQVMVKDFNKFRDRGIRSNEEFDPLSTNLFMLPGEKWRKIRSKLSTTFTPSKLKDMFPYVKEISEDLVKTCESMLNDGDIVEMKNLIVRYTTDSISSIAFGYNCKSLENHDNDFSHYGSMAFNMSPVITALSAFAPTILDLFRIPVFNKTMTKFFINTFQDMVEYRRRNNVVRKDFLNLLVQLMGEGINNDDDNADDNNNDNDDDGDDDHKNDDKLTMSEARAQAFVFFLGGFETSSSTITFLLYELALNPRVQEQVHREIDEHLANGELTFDAIKDGFPYLDMVFSETLRKHPTFALLNRMCIEDWHIPDSNVKIDKGTRILVSVSGLHHDPDIYPNPEAFDPMRFSEENIAKRSAYAYLPFGCGPRYCIGSRFALLQSKLALVAMLTKYRLYPCEKTPIPIDYSVRSFTQTPNSGVYLRVERRTK